MKKALTIIAGVIATMVLIGLAAYVFGLYPMLIMPKQTYERAEAFESYGDYMRAAMCFDSILDYRNSSERSKQAWILAGDDKLEEGNVDAAYACYVHAGAAAMYFDRIDEFYFNLGKKAYEANDRSSEMYFCNVKSANMIEQMDVVRLNAVKKFLQFGDYDEAKRVSSFCSEGVSLKLGEEWLERGKVLVMNNEFNNAYKCFNVASGYLQDFELERLLERVSYRWNKAVSDGLTSENEILSEELREYVNKI